MCRVGISWPFLVRTDPARVARLARRSRTKRFGRRKGVEVLLESNDLAVAKRDDMDEVGLVGAARGFCETLRVADDRDAVRIRQNLPGLEGQNVFGIVTDAQPLAKSGFAFPRARGRVERVVRLTPLDVRTEAGQDGVDVP